jgi:phosphoribosylformylglycinamidine cyclo-ligase
MTDAYAKAGVHIDLANETVARYQSILERHVDPRVLKGVGGFSGCFALQGYRDPVLAASTDGVGTKVLVAVALRRHTTIGADLVNHCINDVLCSNAQPLFFLDYLAMGKLEPDTAAEIVRGIAGACQAQGVALLGGETAEMPGVYTPPHIDLAGTIVGAVERDAIIDGSGVTAGDVIIGLPANGLHTNGYSLARATLKQSRWGEPVAPGGPETIGDALLAVHPCYLPYVRAMQNTGVAIKGMAHITGGGLLDNVPRALPEHLAARFHPSTWRVPRIAELIVREAGLSAEEAYRIFNMGIGFCVIVGREHAPGALAAACAALTEHPIPGALQSAAIVGEVEPRHRCGTSVVIGEG